MGKRKSSRSSVEEIVAPFELAVEVPPRRAVSSVNVRFEDKAVFEALQAWWSLRRGRSLSQWDVFSLLLAAALENGDADLPPGFGARGVRGVVG